MLTKISFKDGKNQTKAVYLTETELRSAKNKGYLMVDGSSLSMRPIESSDAKLVFDGAELVYDKNELEKQKYSKTGEHAIAGLLNNMHALTAFLVQHEDDYARFKPGFEAPTKIAWGYFNRSTVIRAPYYDESKEARVEVRAPVPLGNQYAKMVALHAFMMQGIEEQAKLTKPVEYSLYSSQNGVGNLPSSFSEAKRNVTQEFLRKTGFKDYHEFVSMNGKDAEDYFSTYSEKLFAGPEVEFFLTRSGKRIDSGVYCDETINPVVNDIVMEELRQGLPITKAHHEVAPGQYELGLKYGSATGIADYISEQLRIIRKVSKANSMEPVFSAKPWEGMNGNGMHVHVSLWKNGRNLFS